MKKEVNYFLPDNKFLKVF